MADEAPDGMSRPEWLARLLAAFGDSIIRRDRDFARTQYDVDLHDRVRAAVRDAHLAGTSVEEAVARVWNEYLFPGIVGPDGQPIKETSDTFRELGLRIGDVNDELLRAISRSPDRLYRLHSRVFEELVAEIMARMGFEVALTPRSRDGGFDVRASRREGLGAFLYLVECKRFTPPSKVGVHVVRSLYGAVEAAGATAGLVVTTSYFTRDAVAFQRELCHRLSLVDYVVLQDWLQKAIKWAV